MTGTAYVIHHTNRWTSNGVFVSLIIHKQKNVVRDELDDYSVHIGVHQEDYSTNCPSVR